MTADFDRGRVDLAREADFSLGPIQVRPATRQVESGGTSETLEPRIMQVLVVLARRRGQVVSRDDLIETCWEGRVVGDDALNRCVSKIRKIGETSGTFRLETIPRVGYRLWENDAPANGSRARKPPLWLRLPVLSGLAVLVIILAGAMWFGVLNSKTVEVQPPSAIAILPFDASTDDPEAHRLAGAIVSAIADDLTKSGLAVVPTARSAQYEGARKASAAAELNARFLVNGSVQVDAEGAHVFVTVEHARRRITLWSERINGPAEDVQLMADRVSVQVGRVLGWSGVLKALDSDEFDGARRAAAFLLVIQRSQRGEGHGAIAAAQAMIQIAQDDPEAWSSLAIETINALPQMDGRLRMAALEEARAAAKRAHELDAGSGDSVVADYYVLHPAQWRERLRVLADGQKLVPRDSPPVQFESVALFQTGQINLAVTASARARALDPFSGGKMMNRATILLAAGDKVGAEAMLAEVRRRWPDQATQPERRLEAAVFTGASDEAYALLEALPEQEAEVWKLIIDALRTDAPAARARVASACSVQAARSAGMVRPCLQGTATLGLVDLAFELADDYLPSIVASESMSADEAWMRSPGTPGRIVIVYMPWMSKLRADPRIKDVFERFGLLDYWKETDNWPDFCVEDTAKSVCERMKDNQSR